MFVNYLFFGGPVIPITVEAAKEGWCIQCDTLPPIDLHILWATLRNIGLVFAFLRCPIQNLNKRTEPDLPPAELNLVF